jgi:GAF domain-containing protein
VLPVLPVATGWGLWPALVTAVGGALAFAFFFAPPLLSFAVSDPSTASLLIIPAAVAIVVSRLAERARQRTAEAEAATREVQRIAEEQAALRRVATLVARAAPPEDVFAAVTEEVGRLLGADFANMGRFEANETVSKVGHWSTTGDDVGPIHARLDGRSVTHLVFQTGRPARLDDYADASGEAGRMGRIWGARSSAGVPITVEARLWGVVVVSSSREEPLPADTEARLAGFAELVATAIANAQARSELRSSAEEQAALRRVATLVAEAAPADEVLAAVTEEVGRLLDVDRVSLGRYDDGEVALAAGWWRPGVEVPAATPGRAKLGGRNVSTLVFQTGRPAHIDDYADASGAAAEAARSEGLRASVGVPIGVEGGLWGVISTTSRTGPLPAGTEARLAGFTELVSTAIANTQARVDLREFAEEQAALRRVATLVAGAVPPEEVFAAVTAEVGRVLAVDVTNLVQYDPDGEVTIVGGWARNGTAMPRGARLPLGGHNVATRVLHTGRPYRIDDYAHAATGPVADFHHRLGIRAAVVGAPVSVEGRLWGVMVVLSADDQLPAGTEARLAGFTDLVATAIANAQARVEVRGFAEEQAALRRVATLVARAAPPEEVFAAVTAEVGHVLSADIATLARYDADGTAVFVGTWSERGVTTSIPVGMRLELGGNNPTSLVFETGLPARIHYADASGQFAHAARERGIHSSVGAPISVEGRLWGVMGLLFSRERRLPADIEARLAGFTELVATAIANAEGRAALTASRARVVAAGDETRRRLERDLHDGIQQGLVALILQAAAAGELPDDQVDQMRAELVELRTGLVAALDEPRETSRGIHPSILSEAGLGAALGSLARRCVIPVVLELRVEEPLPEPVEAAAYYVVAEALTNAVKHAGASEIEVVVARHDGMLRVRVRDDGRGGADLGRGTGLVGLTDRVEALGGRLAVHSQLAAGTTLEAVLPLPAADGRQRSSDYGG